MDDTTRVKNRENIAAHIYTQFPQIKEEVERRWNDQNLKKRVEEFFGSNMLDVFSSRPRAVLSRSIGTPNKELGYFLDLAKELGLEPLILEYPDKFVAKNLDKYHLCRMFFTKVSKKGVMTPVATLKIIDFNEDEGKNLRDIKTTWGENIIEFHHKLLHSHYPEVENKILDFSEWFNKTRYISNHYYLYFLALFIRNGVLFDNFLIEDKEEGMFINSKFLPSLEEAERIFGMKPLIFPLLPFENEQFTQWLSYPEQVKNMLESHFILRRKVNKTK